MTTNLEEKRCPHCHEFHDVDDERAYSGSDHDLVQADRVWKCDQGHFPSEEALADTPPKD